MSIVIEKNHEINNWTEEEQLMLNIAKEVAINEIRPRVKDLESSKFPMDLFEMMQEMGFRNMMMPEEYGGLNQSMALHVAVVEEFAKENLVWSIVGAQNMIGELLVEVATEEQKAKFFPKYSEEGGMAGFAFTEPTAGSDAGGIQTTAVKDGDDWIINGQKTFISYIGSCTAFLVSARTNETGKGGISSFLVEKDTPGFEVGSIFHKLGMRGSETGELFFKNVRVPSINMIGPENKGLSVVLNVLDNARLAIAAAAVGTAQGALDRAIAFIKEREQFGKKISSFQGIQWYIAEMDAQVQAARALTYEVARQFDAGESITLGAARAKFFAGEMAIQVCSKAVQLCGGYGTVDDFGLERYYRDAKICTITEGTSEILKTVIARGMLS